MSYHIVVTTDFSEEAASAYTLAKEQARYFPDARISLITILEDAFQANLQFEFGVSLVDAEAVMFQAHKRAQDLLDAIIDKEFSGLTVKGEVIRGLSAVDIEITDYAQKNEADLIVIATHGRTGIRHLILGSVAERVLRSSKCPVLVGPKQ